MTRTYHEQLKIKYAKQLREQLEELPSFLGEFFIGVSSRVTARSKCAYAYDLGVFFNYLRDREPKFLGKDLRAFTLEDLKKIRGEEIARFLDYITYYERPPDKSLTNQEYGKSRKLAAVRTLFSYFYKMKKLDANPAGLVDFPKPREKEIIRLEVDEVARLLDEVEQGEKLTAHQKKYHDITRLRDTALISLLLGTGMRVSECVGIDLGHLDFDLNGVKVTRKGGDEVVLFFGREVRRALLEYLPPRKELDPLPGHEPALFLSLQNKRLTVRAVQNLVKKYSKLVTTLKNISPHKLRSTYGTNLYRETGDIYLVADVLGHVDVNTTRKHYAHMDEDRRRQAANAVKLRED
jgi:site-specific recombinase XerD